MNRFYEIYLNNKIFNKLSKDEIINNYHYFINDRNSQIKSFMLYKLYEIKIDKLENIFYPFIFDNSLSTRQYARNILSKIRDYDFHYIYRNELSKDSNIYGSINGLSELGDKTDVSLILKHLNDNIIKNVKASLNAVARLDFVNHKDTFIKYLKDERFGVSKTAYLLIKENINYYQDNEIYAIYKTCNLIHVKRFTSVLLMSFSKWKALKYILELMSEKDEFIQNLCVSELNNWIKKFNKTFLKPIDDDILSIKLEINRNKNLLRYDQLEFILFVLKDY